MLGNLYNEGKGVPQDYVQAASWYRKAAEQGQAFSQLMLSFLHFGGKGVLKDIASAYMWANLVAANSDMPRLRKMAIEFRDQLATIMSRETIEEGQRLSRECLARNYKNC